MKTTIYENHVNTWNAVKRILDSIDDNDFILINWYIQPRETLM